MSTSNKLSYVTVEEYLANEERSPIKHEYVDGQVFAMTGAIARHRTIAGNIYTALRSHVRGSRCRADIAEAKVHVEATNSFYYPDVVVSCWAGDDTSIFADNPVLIVEVLSRSTSAIDRREKVFAYKKIPSLKEYMIVYQRSQRVELHRRSEDGSWSALAFDGDKVELESIPIGTFELSFDVIYEDVKWPPKPEPRVREAGFDELTEEAFLDW